MKKHIYPKGTVLALEEHDDTVTVLKSEVKIIRPTKGVQYKELQYLVKNTEGKFWIAEHQILSEVKYQPVVLESAVYHAELCQELFGYENMRDFVETIKPRNRAEKITLLELKKLLENMALIIEGTSNESFHAKLAVEEIMR